MNLAAIITKGGKTHMYQTDMYESMLAETISIRGHNDDIINAYFASRIAAWLHRDRSHKNGSKQLRRRDVRVSTLSEFDGEPRSQQPLHALRLIGGSSTRRADQALQPDDARGGSVTRARETGAKRGNFLPSTRAPPL